jgi:hypothetical protein
MRTWRYPPLGACRWKCALWATCVTSRARSLSLALLPGRDPASPRRPSTRTASSSPPRAVGPAGWFSRATCPSEAGRAARQAGSGWRSRTGRPTGPRSRFESTRTDGGGVPGPGWPRLDTHIFLVGADGSGLRRVAAGPGNELATSRPTATVWSSTAPVRRRSRAWNRQRLGHLLGFARRVGRAAAHDRLRAAPLLLARPPLGGVRVRGRPAHDARRRQRATLLRRLDRQQGQPGLGAPGGSRLGNRRFLVGLRAADVRGNTTKRPRLQRCRVTP